MKLTAEQRAALDALPPKRRAFVLAYCGESAGNGSDAARRAGYRWVRVNLPRAGLLEYATASGHVAQPEMVPIVMDQVARDMRQRAMRGQLG